MSPDIIVITLMQFTKDTVLAMDSVYVQTLLTNCRFDRYCDHHTTIIISRNRFYNFLPCLIFYHIIHWTNVFIIASLWKTPLVLISRFTIFTLYCIYSKFSASCTLFLEFLIIFLTLYVDWYLTSYIISW